MGSPLPNRGTAVGTNVVPVDGSGAPTAVFIKGIAKLTSEAYIISVCSRFGDVLDCQVRPSSR